jgi:hypothetical protein
MSFYIFSTHTNPVQYVEYDLSSNKNHNVIKRRFLVAGGHGLCNKALVTPQGVITRVDTQEEMDWLNSLPAFKSDIAKGFITVTKRREESEKVVKNMVRRDNSAPKTEKDFVRTENGGYRSFNSVAVSPML